MKFMPFDIDQHLKVYNQTKKANKTRSDFNFLRGLSEESLVEITLANELLHKSAQLGTLQSSAARSGLYDTITEQIAKSNFQGIRESLKRMSAFIEEDKVQSWYTEQHRRLKTTELWEQISTLPANKSVNSQLSLLKAQWLSEQSRFSSHSNCSLLFTAENILTFFTNYINYCSLELRVNQYKIPKNIRLAYQEHLKKSRNELRESRESICQNMLIRLQLAASSADITYSDHIYHTVQFLSRHKLIKQKCDPPSLRRNDLSSTHFIKFLGYIGRFGNESQKKSLLGLCFFKQDEKYMAWLNTDSLIIAPRAFYDRGLAPPTPPWFPRLFKLRQFRYQFLENNVWLFSSLRLMNQFPFNNHDIDTSIAHIKEIEERLNKANQEIQAIKLSRLQRLFSKKMLLFKFEWAQYHQEAKTNLLKKKMALIASIHQNLSRHNATFLDFKPIKAIIDEICADLSKIHLPAKECEFFYSIKLSLTNKQSATDITAPKSITQTQLSTNPFDTRPLSTNPFDSPPKTSPKKPNNTDPILLDLVKNLSLTRLDHSNFHEIISSIKKVMAIISPSNEPQDKKLLKNATVTIFVQYLKHMSSINSIALLEQDRTKFDAIEQLLLIHAEEHIKYRVKTIIDCRQKPNSFITLNLKCRSYLASYQQKITPQLITHSAIINTRPSPTLGTHQSPQSFNAR